MEFIVDYIKMLDYKKIFIICLYLALNIICFIYLNNKISVISNNNEDVVLNDNVIISTISDDYEKFIFVDVKGAIKKPGVYKLEFGSRVIDQTTTNMIQKFNLLFARNPLISKEI